MDTRRFQRLSEIFTLAREATPDERAAILDRECAGDESLRGEVESLLRDHDSPTLLPVEHAVAGELVLGEIERTTAPLPDSIGPYEIRAILGEGGMGIVYDARQESPRRRVALKVIRSGIASEEAQRRFLVEAEVLGCLRHPGIAQIYEAGDAETPFGTVPYFAMEFVDGRALDHHVREQRLGHEALIELIIRIAGAIDHAHQRGIIHRDLKPANILVERDGSPKILDFGVARVTTNELDTATVHTLQGQLVGTLGFMSPEQLEGDPRLVDTRSDVYSLGAILFELLTGRLPKPVEGLALHVVVDRLRGESPLLGSADPRLRGSDLEAVVARALECEKERRYASAREFALDLERILKNEPVLARPQTTFYQMRKFVARRKGLVAAVTLVALALVTLTSVSVWQAEAAREQRDNALVQRRRSDEVVSFIRDLFASIEPENGGPEFRVVHLLDLAYPRLDELGEAPELRDSLREILGVAYKSTASYARSRELLDGWVESLRARGDSEQLLGGLMRLAALELADDRAARAVELLEEALALAGNDESHVAKIRVSLGVAYFQLGRLEDSDREFNRGIPVLRADPQTTSAAVSAMISYSQLCSYRESTAKAFAILRDCVEKARSVDDQTQLAKALRLFTIAALNIGENALAEESSTESLEMTRKLFVRDHPRVASALLARALVHEYLGRFDESRRLYVDVLEIQERVLGPEHRDIIATWLRIADLEYSAGNIDAVADAATKALEIARRRDNERSTLAALATERLAVCAQWRGDNETAQRLLREAAGIFEEREGEYSPQLASCLHGIGIFRYREQKYGDAEVALRRGLDIRVRTFGRDNVETAQTMYELGLVLWRLERDAEALELLRSAVATHERAYGDASPVTQRGRHHIARLLRAEEDLSIQIAAYRRFLDGRTDLVKPELLIQSHYALGRLLMRDGQLAEAEKALRRAVDMGRRTSPGSWQEAIALSWLAETLRVQAGESDADDAASATERLAEADRLIVPSYRVLLEQLGPEDPFVIEAHSRLVQFLEQIGDDKRLAEWREPPPGELEPSPERGAEESGSPDSTEPGR